MSHGLLNNQTPQQYYNGTSFGGYQFVSLLDIIDNFTATYIGEGKLLEKTLRSDVSFHAHRALAELSFDTLKSCKSQEVEIPACLTMPLPQDYINYVKLSWSDAAGIQHVIYPTSKSSNPAHVEYFSFDVLATIQDGSVSILLDGIYTNIIPGMKVSGPIINTHPNMPAGGWIIKEVSTQHYDANSVVLDPAVTEIELFEGDFSLPTPFTQFTFVGDVDASEVITISNVDGSPIIMAQDSGIVVGGHATFGGIPFNTSGPWDDGDYTMTSEFESTIAGIEVGMLVLNWPSFQTGTKVTNVSGAVITVDTPAFTSPSSAGYIYFALDPNDDSNCNSANSNTWSKYKSATPSENNNDDYEDDTYWPAEGSRFGLDPQHAQVNGSYFIDCAKGKIHFSSNLSGKTIILEYISDGLGTDEEMMVPKLAEEAMYKWIAYGCVSARIDIPEYVINRYKKERFAETRKAKLRLSNIKLEEITQILRGKSKQIKH